MQAQMRNTYDTLWTSPSSCLLIQQNMTLLIWINILEIKKSFLIYFTAKNTKVNLILVVLRSQAVVWQGNWKPRHHANQVGSPFSCTSEHPFAEIPAECYLSWKHYWNLKISIHIVTPNLLSYTTQFLSNMAFILLYNIYTSALYHACKIHFSLSFPEVTP